MQWFSTSCRSIQRLLAENGQRFDRVQRVVGHKDPRSTQLYADMAEYQVRQALEAGQ
jgi:site-specific recombinase XerD